MPQQPKTALGHLRSTRMPRNAAISCNVHRFSIRIEPFQAPNDVFPHNLGHHHGIARVSQQLRDDLQPPQAANGAVKLTQHLRTARSQCETAFFEAKEPRPGAQNPCGVRESRASDEPFGSAMEGSTHIVLNKCMYGIYRYTTYHFVLCSYLSLYENQLYN